MILVWEVIKLLVSDEVVAEDEDDDNNRCLFRLPLVGVRSSSSNTSSDVVSLEFDAEDLRLLFPDFPDPDKDEDAVDVDPILLCPRILPLPLPITPIPSFPALPALKALG